MTKQDTRYFITYMSVNVINAQEWSQCIKDFDKNVHLGGISEVQ